MCVGGVGGTECRFCPSGLIRELSVGFLIGEVSRSVSLHPPPLWVVWRF